MCFHYMQGGNDNEQEDNRQMKTTAVRMQNMLEVHEILDNFHCEQLMVKR